MLKERGGHKQLKTDVVPCKGQQDRACGAGDKEECAARSKSSMGRPRLRTSLQRWLENCVYALGFFPHDRISAAKGVKGGRERRGEKKR